MLMKRRDCLSIAKASMCGALASSRSIVAQSGTQEELERRIFRLIQEYEQQGFHRTGTAVDLGSGDWLCEEVRRIGLVPERESFALSRIDPAKPGLIVRDRRIEGLPLFDGTFTDAD